MSKTGFYQREYNIINFEPALINKRATVLSEPILPKIAPSSTKSFQKNFSTINMTDDPTTKNSYPFENVVNHMKEKKKYDPLLETKIYYDTKYDKGIKPNLFNSSKIDYDFISFAKKKNPQTQETIKETNPHATYKKSAVSEFAHLGRVTNPNFNENFKNVYKRDNTAFRLRNGMGGQYLDSQKTYGEIGKCWKKSGKTGK